MPRQDQFLEVIDRDEAERRFHAQVNLEPIGTEPVSLHKSLGRLLAVNIHSQSDVPSFDRSNVDGYATRASDTYGCSEEKPASLILDKEVITPGIIPNSELREGHTITIATGAMIPRGADSVVMIEHSYLSDKQVAVIRPVTPGAHISFAGTDIALGEVVLRKGIRLTSRETGVLAALGITEVCVYKQPRVGIISTGNEIIAPGESMKPGLIFDSNARILTDAVSELSCHPIPFGIYRDDKKQIDGALQRALKECDFVVMSGGTSKGAGDLNYQVVEKLKPGIVVHGVALKPGKPICMAVSEMFSDDKTNPDAVRKIPVVILPGFPTSAIFTFHEFVAPILHAFAGHPQTSRHRNHTQLINASLPMRIHSERGRTEYLLVNLVEQIASDKGTQASETNEIQWTAFPMGKGSGSVTSFSRADGFIKIERNQELLDSGQSVDVCLLGDSLEPADLVAIGSHCQGLDLILNHFHEQGGISKYLTLGSHGGLRAVKNGECDIAGIHLLDPVTNVYNIPFLNSELDLIPGYKRQQGVVFRAGDARFENRTLEEILDRTTSDAHCQMVNRNLGSGTRILIDQMLADKRPPGYAMQPHNHQAVVAAVQQERADWGIATKTAIQDELLGFLPIVDEIFDFVVLKSRRERDSVKRFCNLLFDNKIREELSHLGLTAY